MTRKLTKPTPGEFLKCQNPSNHFDKGEMQLLRSDYNTAVHNRLWKATVIPPCKKAKSVLEGQLLMNHLLSTCDRTLASYLTLNEMAEAIGLTVYRTRKLVKALDEVNIITYAQGQLQLLPVPKGHKSVIDMYLNHYNSRKRA